MQGGPVILITGASSGFGEATARLFGKEGYRVVLAARREERLRNLADEIRSEGGEALPYPCNVSMLEDIQDVVEATINEFNQIDILLNNAGFGRLNWLEQLDPVMDIQSQIEVNLLGMIQMARAVLPHMIERRKGHIINIGSMSSFLATPTYSIYAATKFGVRGFTDALRREMSIYNIHVTGIYPGGAKTEFSQHVGARRKTGITTPAFLRLSSEDIAMTVMKVVRRPRRSVILPWPMFFALWVNALVPGLVDWVIEKGFVSREKT